MELIDNYLRHFIHNFRLWIVDNKKQIYEVRCQSLVIKSHDIYMNHHKGHIVIEKWVWDNINRDAAGWRDRMIMLLTENMYQDVTPYKIVSHKATFFDDEDIMHFEFVCKEDRGDD